MPTRVPTTVVRELSAVNGLRSTVAIAAEWVGIILAVVLSQRFLHPIFLPVVVVWIGARQHALAILMHDGAHYLLFKNRRLNAVVSELFLAWPLFITMRAYRGGHFAHHRHVNTEKDHARPQYRGALRDRKRPCVHEEPDDAPIIPGARLRGSPERQLPSRTWNPERRTRSVGKIPRHRSAECSQ